jgi:hypothetical protein
VLYDTIEHQRSIVWVSQMNLVEAIRKSSEAAEIISNLPTSFSAKEPFSPGVGVGLSPDGSQEYRIVFHLVSESDRERTIEIYKKLELQEPPVIKITGKAFSLPSLSTINNQRNRPLQVGDHISPLNLPGGTLGCFVQKLNDPRMFLLSCTHVLTSLNGDTAGTPILQPGSSTSLNDQIARLDQFIPLTPISSGNFVNSLDAAIAEIICQQTIDNIANIHTSIMLRGEHSEETIEELIVNRRRVLKIGSASGQTFGWIKETNLKVEIWYEDSQQSQYITCGYQNLLSIDSSDPDDNAMALNQNPPFGVPGDSGSLIYDESGYAVGLLIGGTKSGITYALPIAPILDRLGVQLILN